MLTDIPGVQVGHVTDEVARTGVTVILFPPGSIASGEIRGGAPATREFALLDPTRTVDRVDAVCLSGGSAFGLAAADGVMEVLADQGRGFETKAGHVPIVIGMSLFDLAVGDGSVRPTAADGRAATEAAGAMSRPHQVGRVGAGCGATVGKWLGPDRTTPGGVGVATLRMDDVIVSALVAVNAYGDIDDGTSVHDPGPRPSPEPTEDTTRDNTTIGVIVTNAVLDKLGCHLLAQSGHDGLARALHPAHTAFDGDALVAVATGSHAEPEGTPVDLARLRVLAQHVVTMAVRSVSVQSASESSEVNG